MVCAEMYLLLLSEYKVIGNAIEFYFMNFIVRRLV